ncbi:putative TIM-barrel fold metal-dependent hydrolase [Amycolatopsis bartoniae]|uniref:Amidohydrolase n=1 Tax=Amycolatopsis bartoniae TaxID=941986 RepID=A0A8H9MBM7_9PSEU|nr:amidohydrolase family protein [Amycolatopsis bartoniae]MBB2939674.1 putative TIM-barrel fold metal-dependent hydrolase [Amycolatopsis bartoniae]TVT06204.1 amidohydrolase [Amycolatopsis bartoniae]GHF36602.1 amidohydrolase [Amycolatopsis bartoniae]
MSELPKIISVDDHVVEPPTLWQERLPAKHRAEGPHVERRKGQVAVENGKTVFREGADGPHSGWSDVWVYQDMAWPLHAGYAQYGVAKESREPVVYDEIHPGCWNQDARLAAMDSNHNEASLCFPTVPRFCGQTFLEREDKELALLCVRAYNDWTIDEWCGGAGKGRLIPVTLIPLWDVQLAAEEVRRCADKGAHAIAFSEAPHALGLPSVHSDYWEPLWQACNETETTVNMHIGSSSRMPSTSADAPQMVGVTLNTQNSIHAVTDWIWSGVFVRHPKLKIALSEGQVGWMPFYYERMDSIWKRAHLYDATLKERMPEPPSSYGRGHVYGCIFDDVTGLRQREYIGMNQIMLEIDFPHSDSTYPHTRKVVEDLCHEAGLTDDEARLLVRGSAIECFGLERFGIAS